MAKLHEKRHLVGALYMYTRLKFLGKRKMIFKIAL